MSHLLAARRALGSAAGKVSPLMGGREKSGPDKDKCLFDS